MNLRQNSLVAPLKTLIRQGLDTCFPQWRTPVPNNLASVGYWRYVQNLRETGERRNPDDQVQGMLTTSEKRKARAENLEEVRQLAFYHHVLARTRFYDQFLLEALEAGCRQLVNIGVGTDTRSFRFQAPLDQHGVRVVECEMEPWVTWRRAKIKKRTKPQDFSLESLNLDEVVFAEWLKKSSVQTNEPTAFLLEGVTPYIRLSSWKSFLQTVAESFPRKSRIGYDFKLNASTFGEEKVRFPRDPERIREFHAEYPFQEEALLLGSDFQKAYTNYEPECPYYDEDGAIRLVRV